MLTERQEQILLFEWMSFHPELDVAYASANGGSRHIIEAKNLKRMGCKAGVPDIHIPIACGPYHSLYIELKRIKGGKISTEQAWYIDKLNDLGHKAVVCRGFDNARKTIMEYLSL